MIHLQVRECRSFHTAAPQSFPGRVKGLLCLPQHEGESMVISGVFEHFPIDRLDRQLLHKKERRSFPKPQKAFALVHFSKLGVCSSVVPLDVRWATWVATWDSRLVDRKNLFFKTGAHTFFFGVLVTIGRVSNCWAVKH